MLDGKKILFAAGGTAGHINPALAVAGLIHRLHPETQILFVGTADHMEARLVPEAGFRFASIDISGFQRSLSLQNIKRNLGTLRRLLRVTGQVERILDAFQPDAAVGFGGYVSGPVLRTAAKRGIPTAIHEQNAFPGVTNKALAKKVDAVMLTAEAAGDRMQCKYPPIHTGLPIRREFLRTDRAQSRRELGLDTRRMALSAGGSLGAKAINESVTGMLSLLWKEHTFCFHHAYGQYGKWVPERLRTAGIDIRPPELTVREYIDDMPRCMAAADLVIARAGASTLSELQAMGKPSILIPSPNVAENHQYHNAKVLADRGAAVLLEESELTPQRLAETVRALLGDPVRLEDMSKAAKALAVTDAAERIYDGIDRLLSPSSP
ncbi:MAG: undecaprenyldiphospho-muramoylpentapeptide beta-N-acetylglucosaminyltransferase [Oscillospiraceae bacterium]|jgi:UDP-N-acetylglucosamine--N-acetylmuramyl-(pentapeptide) pyrophosphoryl-undecaprenol N-acetylglucosamine transferase|nr:undecaprenyldiphospho-muramoylpentapeptide beta-N-acetylglucosaminyltransferase [Oscillospiraceae bacterium]